MPSSTSDTMKDFYAALGVAETANQTEIQAAWRVRSAMIHPDKFDRTTQSAQWHAANAMFAELREAYATLGDPSKRSSYDRLRSSNGRGTHSSSARQSRAGAYEPHSRVPDPDPALLSDRFLDAAQLPVEGLMVLAARKKGPGVLFRRNSPRITHLFLVVVGIAVTILLFSADRQSLSANLFGTFVGGALTALLIGYNVLHIWLDRSTPFGKGIVITPYYFGDVRWDRCQLLPLLSLKDVSLTHHYTNGMYSKTAVCTKWFAQSLDFEINARDAAEEFSRTLVDAANRVRQMFANGKGSEIVSQFGFANDLKSQRSEHSKSQRIRALEFGCVAGALVISAIFSATLPAENSVASTPARVAEATPSYTPTQASPQETGDGQLGEAVAPPDTFPPETGAQVDYSNRRNRAPFRLDARGKAGNFLIRLRDTETGSLVTDIFVRGGEITKNKVPLGRYDLLIASGTNWYGFGKLFGDEGQYGKANQTAVFSIEGDQLAGHELVLEESVAGNLRKSAVRRQDF